MKAALAAIILIISVPAFADNEAWKNRQVPDPIPPAFNECVRVIWTEKGRANGIKFRVSQFDAPLTRRIHAYLEYYRREGWGKLELCGEHKT